MPPPFAGADGSSGAALRVAAAGGGEARPLHSPRPQAREVRPPLWRQPRGSTDRWPGTRRMDFSDSRKISKTHTTPFPRHLGRGIPHFFLM